MIEDFHETDDPNQISTYAGMMTTVFALAEFSTGAIWGRVSDKVGRKPVIVIALLGTATSMLLLGLSSNIMMALCARVLAGLLNGFVNDSLPFRISVSNLAQIGTSASCKQSSVKWSPLKNIKASKPGLFYQDSSNFPKLVHT